ncbi:MAG: uroporphyrinogen decarboxylase [Alicyclobacillus sp.]|nr:uroporphyrinogen decarboxylase [Alicyclobacillus sp.]
MPENRVFLDACAKRPVPYVPVWFMRQAGRYQPEYQAIRKRYSLLEICRNPEICAQVTRLPVDQLGVDAAILFSDIMVPVGAMGMPFDIQEGIGPVVSQPIRSMDDVQRLIPFDAEESLPYVLETIRLLKRELSVPLIGFAGAPFTLASYMVEGKPDRSKNYVRTKQLMWSAPEIWDKLMQALGDMAIQFLTAQVKAGADAVQLFDSWVGHLAPSDFERFILPTMKRIFSALQPLGVPMIYFGVGTGELLPLMADCGPTVIGVDFRVPLRQARQRTHHRVAIQGNLDSTVLFAPWQEIERKAREVLDAGMEEDGFIFNLGQSLVHHQPPVNPDTLRRLTEFVHTYSRDQLQHRTGR